VIPSSITTIGDLAFAYIPHLSKAYFYGNVPTTWGQGLLYGPASNFTIYYPEGNTSGWTSPTWTAPDGTVYNTATFIPEIASDSGFTYIINDDGTATITGFVGEESGDLIIPGGIDGYTVSGIGDRAFLECWNFIGKLVIPDSIKTIGDGAFTGCSGFRGDLIIPSSVETIGAYAFMGCSGFNSELVIPEGVISIGETAFQFCNFERVHIPRSVISLGGWAFAQCQELTEVYFYGDVPMEWGDFAISYDCVQDEIVTIYYPEGNTSGWTSPTWYAPDKMSVYNTATFVPERDLILSLIKPSIARGQELDLRISSVTRLTDAYLQFDDGNGNWFTDEYCAGNETFRINPYSFDVTDERYLYNKTLVINTAGSADRNYARKVRVASVDQNGNVSYSDEVVFYVYGGDETPSSIALSVSPSSGKRGETYTINAALDVLPAYAYLVFDNPSSGDWMPDEYCMQYYAVSVGEYSFNANSNQWTLAKSMTINTAGSAYQDFNRRVKLVYLDEQHNRYETDAVSFCILNDSIAVAPQISSLSYSISNKTLIFRLNTTDADCIRIYDGQKILHSVGINSDAYTSQNTWEIPVSLNDFVDKKLIFRACSSAYGENTAGKILTVPKSEVYVMAEPYITSPVEPAVVILEDGITLKWTIQDPQPDRYTLTVSRNNTKVYTSTVAGTALSCSIPGSVFTQIGQYSVRLIAEKNGYTSSSAIINIYCSAETIKNDGKNPTKQEMYDFVVRYLSELNYSNNEHFSELINLCCSMFWKESTYRHFVNGTIYSSVNGKDKGIDWGISQINDTRNNWEDIRDIVTNPDWKIAAAFGIDILLEKYFQLSVHQAAVEGKYKMNYTLEEAWAAAAYCTYNTGSNPSRFYTPDENGDYADIDTIFMEIYRTKPWLKGVSTSTVEAIQKTAYTSVGIVVKKEKSDQTRFMVYSSPGSGSKACGWLGVGDTVYITGEKNGYYLIFTDELACGYISKSRIKITQTVEINKTEEETKIEVIPDNTRISETICDGPTTAIVGEEVTFKVYVPEGAKDFKIKVNDLDYAAVNAEFKDVKLGDDHYLVRYTFRTTGANRVLITCTGTDGFVYNAKPRWNVTVGLNKDDWTGSYQSGKLTINHVSGDLDKLNRYGLYVKKSELFSDEYYYGKDNDKDAYGKPIAYQLSTWNIRTDLNKLEPGSYEYGIVSTAANAGGGNVYLKLGTFKVDEFYTYKEKTMYVISRDGADIYGGITWYGNAKNKFAERLAYNEAVTVYVGGEKDKYYRIKYIHESVEVEAYVAKRCLGNTIAKDEAADTSISKQIDNENHPYPDFYPCWPVEGNYYKVNAVYYYVKGGKHTSTGAYYNQDGKLIKPDNNYIDISRYEIDPTSVNMIKRKSIHKYDLEGNVVTSNKYDSETATDIFGPNIVSVYEKGVIVSINDKCTHNKYAGSCACKDKGTNIAIEYATKENVYRVYYQHLHSIADGLKVGDEVSEGQVIGKMGNTGASSYIHLHYAIWVNDIPVNPIIFYMSNPKIQLDPETDPEFYDNEGNIISKLFADGRKIYFKQAAGDTGAFREYYKCYFDENGRLLDKKCHGGGCEHELKTIRSVGFYSFKSSNDLSNVNNFRLTTYAANAHLEHINTITASTSVATSFEVASRTGSFTVEIPHDPATQTVEIRQGGRVYGNGEEILFTTSKIVFDVALIEKYGGEETVYTFTLTKKMPVDECNIRTIYATFYNEFGEVVGSDMISSFADCSVNVPYSTARVVFSHAADGNYSYIRHATAETLANQRYLPKDIPAVMDEESDTFTIGIYTDAGREVASFAYTLQRMPKSSAAVLYPAEVYAYDHQGELIGMHEYPAENIQEIRLPYGTETIDLIAYASSFAEKICTLNDVPVMSLDNLPVKNGDVIGITVIAEDGTTEEYVFHVLIGNRPDVSAPVITLTGKSGQQFSQGDTVSGNFTITLADDSWCWYTLFRDGEEIEDVEITDAYSLTEYTIEASDIFGNTSTLTFKYLVDPSAVYTISGKISSYGSDDYPVIVRVLDESGNEIDSMRTKDSYSFTLPAGSYVLEVSKKNHVTRRYSFQIGN